jgi:hypothetical protein
MRKIALALILIATTANAQTPPVDPNTVCGVNVGKETFVRFMSGDCVTQSQKDELIRRLTVEHEVQDREGNVWSYRCGRQPYIVRYGQ